MCEPPSGTSTESSTSGSAPITSSREEVESLDPQQRLSRAEQLSAQPCSVLLGKVSKREAGMTLEGGSDAFAKKPVG